MDDERHRTNGKTKRLRNSVHSGILISSWSHEEHEFSPFKENEELLNFIKSNKYSFAREKKKRKYFEVINPNID